MFGPARPGYSVAFQCVCFSNENSLRRSSFVCDAGMALMCRIIAPAAAAAATGRGADWRCRLRHAAASLARSRSRSRSTTGARSRHTTCSLLARSHHFNADSVHMRASKRTTYTLFIAPALTTPTTQPLLINFTGVDAWVKIRYTLSFVPTEKKNSFNMIAKCARKHCR